MRRGMDKKNLDVNDLKSRLERINEFDGNLVFGAKNIMNQPIAPDRVAPLTVVWFVNRPG